MGVQNLANTLEPFHQGRLVRILLRFPIRYPVIPIVIFGSYWLIPLAILAASASPDGTLSVLKVSTSYVQDLTHFIYAALISLGAVPVYIILRKTSPIIRHTLQIVKGETDYAQWRSKYGRYQNAAFSWLLVIACAGLALAVFLILLSRALDDQYSYWWGHISNGYAGIYVALIASQMVFWGTWSFFIVTAVSLIISHIARCRLDYQPLRADGCNGLRPLGFLIMLMWAYSLLAAAAIYVVFSRGYLDLELNPGIWFISLVGSLCLPLVAILPLFSVTVAITKARDHYLLDLEALSRSSATPKKMRDVEKLNRFLEVRELIVRSNSLPFRNRAVVLFSILNLLQVGLAAREFLL
jgi:hypothetical protein